MDFAVATSSSPRQMFDVSTEAKKLGDLIGKQRRVGFFGGGLVLLFGTLIAWNTQRRAGVLSPSSLFDDLTWVIMVLIGTIIVVWLATYPDLDLVSVRINGARI